MEDMRPDEEFDLQHDSYVLLRYFRRWPHFVVEWNVRRRGSEGSSFPVSRGEVISRAEADWDTLRQQALDAAGATAPGGQSAAHAEEDSVSETGGVFGRFRRKP